MNYDLNSLLYIVLHNCLLDVKISDLSKLIHKNYLLVFRRNSNQCSLFCFLLAYVQRLYFCIIPSSRFGGE